MSGTYHSLIALSINPKIPDAIMHDREETFQVCNSHEK